MIRVNLAKSAGFCFGVRRAIGIAFKTVSSHKDVYMLGDIVHNEEVTKQIKKAGVKKIKRLSGGAGRILLIRAHGSCAKIIKQAGALGYRIVDATCPMVKEIHRKALEMEKKGYRIIVIGDKKHDEVHGIAGQLKSKALIIPGPGEIPFKKIKKIKKAAVVIQSTQNIEKVKAILRLLKPHIGKLKFFNTICLPTTIKQKEVRLLPRKNDAMVIIGSRASANTKRLYEIAKSLNKKSYWVSSRKDIKPAWFKGINSVGITAGSSTPDSITREIVAYICRLS